MASRWPGTVRGTLQVHKNDPCAAPYQELSTSVAGNALVSTGEPT